MTVQDQSTACQSPIFEIYLFLPALLKNKKGSDIISIKHKYLN